MIVLLFLSEFLVGALAFVFRGGLAKILTTELRYGIEHHYNATDRGSLAAPSVATIWDALQSKVIFFIVCFWYISYLTRIDFIQN